MPREREREREWETEREGAGQVETTWSSSRLHKLFPVHRAADLDIIAERFESPTARNPKGRSDLPGIDVFVSTADPEKEPLLVTANTILSILTCCAACR